MYYTGIGTVLRCGIETKKTAAGSCAHVTAVTCYVYSSNAVTVRDSGNGARWRRRRLVAAMVRGGGRSSGFRSSHHDGHGKTCSPVTFVGTNDITKLFSLSAIRVPPSPFARFPRAYIPYTALAFLPAMLRACVDHTVETLATNRLGGSGGGRLNPTIITQLKRTMTRGKARNAKRRRRRRVSSTRQLVSRYYV